MIIGSHLGFSQFGLVGLHHVRPLPNAIFVIFVFVFVFVFVSLCVIVLLFSVGAESALFQLCATLPNYTSATNVLCPFGRAGFTSEIFKSGLSHVSCISYIPKWERFSVYSPVKVFKTVML